VNISGKDLSRVFSDIIPGMWRSRRDLHIPVNRRRRNPEYKLATPTCYESAPHTQSRIFTSPTIFMHSFINRQREYCLCHHTNPKNTPVTHSCIPGHMPARISNAMMRGNSTVPWITHILTQHITRRLNRPCLRHDAHSHPHDDELLAHTNPPRQSGYPKR
jgi:hypothetical protein